MPVLSDFQQQKSNNWCEAVTSVKTSMGEQWPALVQCVGYPIPDGGTRDRRKGRDPCALPTIPYGVPRRPCPAFPACYSMALPIMPQRVFRQPTQAPLTFP